MKVLETYLVYKDKIWSNQELRNILIKNEVNRTVLPFNFYKFYLTNKGMFLEIPSYHRRDNGGNTNWSSYLIDVTPLVEKIKEILIS